MKYNAPNHLHVSWQFRVSVMLMFACFSQLNALSQSSNSSQASVRGTAKIAGTFPISEVMVVAVPHGTKGRPSGRPVPAWVNKRGEYRIESLSPGSYDLKAKGKSIKDKAKSNVNIREGDSNIIDFELEMAEQTRTRGSIRDAHGRPVNNAKVMIYSPELSPSVCAECYIAEVSSDQQGEVDYGDLASEQSYSLTVKTTDQAVTDPAALMTTETIMLVAGTEARIELQFGDGPRPVLTATVVTGRPNPLPKQTRPNELAANVSAASSAKMRSVVAGQKVKLTGVITRRDADTFTVQDIDGGETVVLLTDHTSVKSKSRFLTRGSTYGPSNILRGLVLEVEGRGDTSGQLVAEKVRFGTDDLNVARALQARVDPVEDRVGTAEERLILVEQNAQRLSGQLDELAAVSNAARGGAKAAQETASAAVAGVSATNERISALDDYIVQENVAVNFKAKSAVLSRESKQALDQIAQQALNAKGYVLEVRGFASADGSKDANRRLSQRRADAVVRYLVDTHRIPLRRIVTPFGYGESQAIADNVTREGRRQNRRVDVSVLVNRGLMQQAPNMSGTTSETQDFQEPTVDSQDLLLEGEVKLIKLSGANFESIVDVEFEGKSLTPKLSDDGKSLELSVDSALTKTAGDKQINFYLKNGKVKAHTLKVGKKEQ